MSSEIEQLIAEFQRSGLRELHVRRAGFELYLSMDGDAAGLDAVRVNEVAPTTPPATAPSQPAPAPVAAPIESWPEGAAIVRAPYLGTFYRAPKPGTAPYVEVGGMVGAETEICLVEVMKLFTAVRAGVDGVVHAVLATDGEMVAAEQPLFVIVPA